MGEKITPISIEEKMKDAYLSYSLSVIVSRALPDVRDGLKPVHRRILYGCDELGLTSDKPHKKSARLVGEVLGKFHPHGDTALYKTLVRMAQPFTQRYQLIDGHGNFGSIDGDNAAAMRYTEARLTSLAEEMLADLSYDTVPFSDNFDGTIQEPDVLPAAFPNLLINGASGIAVGMSTDIPPHNLKEVIDACLALLKTPDMSAAEIMKFIPGPDFPTGGKIIGNDSIKKAYESGQGGVMNRGKVHLERERSNRSLIISEIPYQVNKTKLIEEITKEIDGERLDNITAVRDESDQEGLRVVVELKYDAEPEIVENRLYKFTSLQKRQRLNMLALQDGKPEVMNIKEILKEFIVFRREVIKRRTEDQLEQEQENLEVLSGLKRAMDQLEKVIAIIRSSQSRQEAEKKLQSELDISERQADAILSMRLHRLVQLERKNLEKELEGTRKKIQNYKEILSDKSRLDEKVGEELKNIRDEYGDERRTEIIADEDKAEINKDDLIKNKPAVISLSVRQRLKRAASRENIRSAKNDYVISVMELNSLDSIIFITETGQSYSLPVHEVSEHHGLSTGDSLSSYLDLPPGEKIIAALPLNDRVQNNYVAICTKMGRIKMTGGEEYLSSISKIKAINLAEGDRVINAFVLEGKEDIIMSSRQGRIIRFSSSELSPSGRNTKGMLGINLNENDSLQVSLPLIDRENLIVTTPSGRLGRLKIEGLSKQSRYGKGRHIISRQYSVEDAVLSEDDNKLLLLDKEREFYTLKVSELPAFKSPPINRTKSLFEAFSPPLTGLYNIIEDN